jgi:hypothetical protein
MKIFKVARHLDESIWKTLRKIIDGQIASQAILDVSLELSLENEEIKRLKQIVNQILHSKPKLSYDDLPLAYRPSFKEIKQAQSNASEIKTGALEWIDIGSTPPEEDCAQVGSINYREKALEECHRYIDVIRKKLGPEPQGARLGIRSNEHDFGTYYEVVCYYSDEDGLNYALACEGYGPKTWDDIAPVSLEEIFEKINAKREEKREEKRAMDDYDNEQLLEEETRLEKEQQRKDYERELRKKEKSQDEDFSLAFNFKKYKMAARKNR